MPEPGKDTDILTHRSQRLPLDRITGGVGVTDTNHSQVHAGNAFHHSQQISLGNGGVLTHTMDVPAGVYVHFQSFSAILSQEYSLVVTEGDTPTTGTEDTPVNRNRNKNIPSEIVLHDAAVTANTTELVSLRMPGNNSKSIGVKDAGIEWVLLPGKSYTFVLTNLSSLTATGHLALDWYEEGAG